MKMNKIFGFTANLVYCRAFLALVLALRGEVERARATAAEGLALAQSVDSGGGMLVTELDAMELGLDLSAESALEKLAELVPKFRITPAGRGRMERTP